MLRNVSKRINLAVRSFQLPKVATTTISLPPLPIQRHYSSSNYAKPIGEDFDMAESFTHSDETGYIRHSAFGNVEKTNQQIHRFVWQNMANWQNHIALVGTSE